MVKLKNKTKVCTKCRRRKLIKYFYRWKRSKDSLHYWCKQCQSKYNKQRYDDPIVRHKKYLCTRRWKKQNKLYLNVLERKSYLKRTYGLTPHDVELLWKKQKQRCAICGTKRPKGRYNNFGIDHCHKTNQVRGLLCLNCNTGLGSFKDRIKILQAAIKYLKRSK